MNDFNDKMADRGFRRDPDGTSIADLNRFLRQYGLEEELNDLQDEEGRIDVGEVLERLPKEAVGGPANEYGNNSAYDALKTYYQAVPPAQRAEGGVRLTPDKMLTRLLNETEYYHELANGLVRMCNGEDCIHFDVCDFKDRARGNDESDGIECMEDRREIMSAINNFVDPDHGQPKVDTRQPAQQLLFEQLVQLLVKQRRITMTMQLSPVIVDQWEILQDGEFEHFDSMNEAEHALVKTWDRTHQRINKTMRAMGISPRFEIQQDRFDFEEEQLDAEQRADELLFDKVEQGLNQLKQLPEEELDKMAPEEAVAKALEEVKEQRREQLEPKEADKK